ncbi:MAG: 50S ribosomal protein L35 [Deltaproteobacteria bacterium RIFOXYA12_FULL_58_15]|nr:MAG: 50S ribosomal protein L35 [Deltaproteobacteria bacterium RIFOXYA12_FULL_58_15]OGR07369.1 MAG: 50S ribosomal protein L35 [Deltaproteobacteria bacterium RIFOXYB12_FULL_58_9]
MAKPKMKTKRAAAKRYRVTGKGKIKTGRKGHRHILTGKSRKQKNHTRGTRILGPSDEAKAKSLLPYAR